MSDRTAPGSSSRTWWIVDGNNVYGSRPDGWWNDRAGASARFAQAVARWCRTLDDEVTIVFDPPLSPDTARLAGGNLTIREAPRRGRDAADHHIVDLVADLLDRLNGGNGDVDDGDRDERERGGNGPAAGDAQSSADELRNVRVVTSDRGLRARLDDLAAHRAGSDARDVLTIEGSGRFRDRIGY